MPKPGPKPRGRAEMIAAMWTRIDRRGPDECWPWTGSRTPDGYGILTARSISAAPLYVHRLVWEETFGPIPPGMGVLHRCDNPPCENRAHFFLGTPKDNVDDAIAKDRFRIGGRTSGTWSKGDSLKERTA